MHAQEFHTSYWGHLGLLDLSDHVLTPGFLRLPAHRARQPLSAQRRGRRPGARPGRAGRLRPSVRHGHRSRRRSKSLTNELPADVANGKVDYIEIVGFSDHKATAAIWYRLLNLGFRLPAGAGTDAMANYASLRGPVGMNRVFLDTGGDTDARQR